MPQGGHIELPALDLIAALEPVFTAIWAYLLFQEQLTAIQLIGSLLIFASVIPLRFGEARKELAIAA